MKFVGLKRFQGKGLAEVLTYLRGDLPKAFLDLTTVLQASTRVPELIVATKAGNMGSNSVEFTLGSITLPKGVWNIQSTAVFDQDTTGHTFDVTRLWMTYQNPPSGIPADAIAGYNYSVFNLVAESFQEMSMSCQWQVETKSPKTIYLQGRSVYGGGAGTPIYSCAMSAHGYVLD